MHGKACPRAALGLLFRISAANVAKRVGYQNYGDIQHRSDVDMELADCLFV